MTPRGSIARVCRIKAAEATDDGKGVELTLSAPAVLVTLNEHTDGVDPAYVRGQFRRFCRGLSITPHPVEFAADGVETDPRTGRRVRTAVATAFQCMGDPAALKKLRGMWFVRSVEFIVNVRPPRMQQPSEWGPAVRGEDTPLSVKRRVLDAKRAAGDRAEDCDRADRRPFTPDPERDTLRGAAAAFGIDPSDPVRMPALAEALRLLATADRTPAESARLDTLRAMLGA